MCWRISLFITTILVFSFSIAVADSSFVKGELLIQLTPGAARNTIEQTLDNIGAEVVEELPQIQVKRIKVPEHALDALKTALSHNPNISFVEENFIAEGSTDPNDEKYPSQWHHVTLMSSLSWDYQTGSTDMPIAIIDSGVDADHPDLVEKLIPGYNFLAQNTNTQDVLGHGTAVAGSAAAATNNGIGVAGMAWQNPVMPLVVLDSSNYATYANIAAAILYAVDHGVKIINISIGGSSYSSTLEYAVNYAWDHNALVFACAHNYSTDTPYYPAACTHAVAVAATDAGDNLASFSNYGSWITLSAPGTSILTTNNGGGYGYWNGTSFASPIAAGAAALAWSANPELTNEQILQVLTASADDLGASGFDKTASAMAGSMPTKRFLLPCPLLPRSILKLRRSS